MELSTMGRALLVLGIVLVAVGLLFLVGGRLGLGRLPGDFIFGKGNVRVVVPLATSLLLSVVLSVVLSLFLRR